MKEISDALIFICISSMYSVYSTEMEEKKSIKSKSNQNFPDFFLFLGGKPALNWGIGLFSAVCKPH